MKFEAGKTYKTRDDREARVYATDGAEPWVIHGAVLQPSGWFDKSWHESGHLVNPEKPNDADLMPPKREAWLNVYLNDRYCGYAYSSRQAADDGANVDARIACIHIEYEEGEGL